MIKNIIIISLIFICSFVFCENLEDEIFYGKWLIVRKITTCGISGLLKEDINNLRVNYNNINICNNPKYNKQIYSDKYYHKLTFNSFCNNGIDVEELGIYSGIVIEVTVDSKDYKVDKRDYPHNLFLIKDQNSMILIFKNVYFELLRFTGDIAN